MTNKDMHVRRSEEAAPNGTKLFVAEIISYGFGPRPMVWVSVAFTTEKEREECIPDLVQEAVEIAS